MITQSATVTRRQTYAARVKSALLHIQAARSAGAKNADQISAYLNERELHAPTNDRWTPDAVLRCLRHLKAWGLDKGSLSPHNARSWGTYNKGPIRKAQRLEDLLPHIRRP